MPRLKKLLTPAEFEERKRKRAEAARRRYVALRSALLYWN